MREIHKQGVSRNSNIKGPVLHLASGAMPDYSLHDMTRDSGKKAVQILFST